MLKSLQPLYYKYKKDLLHAPDKKVYLSSAEGTNKRRRTLERWEDRVKEYVSDRGVRGSRLEWARRECIDRERWSYVSRGHPLGGCFQKERGVKAIG